MASRTLLAGAILALCFASAAHANLLTNGSFENGAFVDNTSQDTDNLALGSTAMTGWTVIGSEGLAWIGPKNPFGLSAEDGSYFLDLTDYQSGGPFSGVSQTINTTAGDHYVLTFELGSSTTYGLPDGVTASAGSTSGTFTSTQTTSSNFWQSETLGFTATGSTTLIDIVGASGANYIGLDNVSVVQTSGVPEPASWSLMLFGFAILGAGLRLRRQGLANAASA
ncbi:MAG TPA: DUF642 domain-containing protein [Caulobacteraceae bacterium]